MSQASPAPSDALPPVDLPPVAATPLPRKYGFGWLVALGWCLAYLGMTQVFAGLLCGVPLSLAAVMIDKADLKAGDPKALMETPNARLAVMLTLVCSHLAGLVSGWFMLRWLVGKSWKRRIAVNRRPAGRHVALLVIGFPAMMALSSLMDPVLKYVPNISDMLTRIGIDFPMGIDAMGDTFKGVPLPLAIFAVAVMPALNEELWCRGFLGHNLAARYAVWPAVLITSILFGFLHIDPRQGTGAALLGVTFHFAYLATRSLWVSVALHLANNGLAMIDLHTGVLKPFEELVERASFPFFCGSAALFGAVAFALWQTRSRLETADPEAIPWKPRAKSGAEVPPADSGVIVTHDPLSPMSVALIVMGAVAFSVIVALG